MQNILKDLKEYINDFEYENIFMSESIMCFTNKNTMEYIQILGTDVYDILNHVLNTNKNLSEIFHCKIQFTTTEWIKMYTLCMTRIV